MVRSGYMDVLLLKFRPPYSRYRRYETGHANPRSDDGDRRCAGRIAPRPAAYGTTRYTSSVQTVVPGVTLTRTRDAMGPVQIRSLKVDPVSPVTVDTTLARGVFPGWARTSQMAAANGAVAAVNGDFGVENGRPLHAFASDGTLAATGVEAGDNFAISQNEQHSYIGPPTETLTLTTPTTSFAINHWNSGAPMWGEISAFSEIGRAHV